MKTVLWTLVFALFFFQADVFTAESKETSEVRESLKPDTEKEKSDESKKADVKKADAEKDKKADAAKADDDDVDAIKSWKAQNKPNTDTNRRDRMETSKSRKSLKNTYKTLTDKDMRSAALRLDN